MENYVEWMPRILRLHSSFGGHAYNLNFLKRYFKREESVDKKQFSKSEDNAK